MSKLLSERISYIGGEKNPALLLLGNLYFGHFPRYKLVSYIITVQRKILKRLSQHLNK